MILRLFLFISGLLGVLFVAGPAHAIQSQKVEEIKPVEFLPQEEFEAKTQLIEKLPFEDEKVAFSVRLAEDWTHKLGVLGNIGIEAGLSNKVLTEFTRYISPPRFNLNSFFTVELQELSYEIGARDWLVFHLLRSGSTLSALTEYSAKEAEALYVIVQGDTTYIVRTKIFLNGPRVILAKYYVPQEDYAKEKPFQAQVINSFKLTNPIGGGVEAYETYGFLDQSYFDYPVSWTLRADLVKSIERMKAYIYRGLEIDKDGEKLSDPTGQIRVHLVSKLLDTRLADEIKKFREGIDYPGYTLSTVLEVKDYKYSEDMIKGRAEVYELEPQNVTLVPYELVISVSEGADYFYFISMLTPSRDTEYYDWARNMEAFRIVAESLRRINFSDDEYYEYLDFEEE